MPDASLIRRAARRAKRELAGWRRMTVRYPEAGSGTGATRPLRGQRLRLVLPDAAGLVRLAASGSFTGDVRELIVDLACAPESQLAAVRPPQLGRTTTSFTWRRRGQRLRVRLRWAKPYNVHRALEDVLRATLRARPWEQASGPLYALDRTAWQQDLWSWPQGRLVSTPPSPEYDQAGRLLGPYHPVPPAPAASTGAPPVTPIVTAVANPFGRRLVGAATGYHLTGEAGRVVLRDTAGRVLFQADPATGPEAAVARSTMDRYAVVTVDTVVAETDRFRVDCLRALAACGVVYAAAGPRVRSALDRLGLVTVADPVQVADLAGYALSVESVRRTVLAADPALRRTELGAPPTGGGVASANGHRPHRLPLPGITAVVSTMRAEHLDALIGYLAAQTYPALEAVIGLHGYDLSPAERERLVLPFPVRVVSFPATTPFGEVLGRLSRMADGDLITKLDDDDHYGPNHLTDLFIAWHTSGADLVAKGARFVHFPERGETIDRAWAAPELFNVTPAGGTMLLGRGTLAQFGGWSHSSKHVDADLLARIRSAGGLVYRTHALEYLYVRRSTGHTFVAELDELLSHGERTYPDLPPEIVHPEYGPARLVGGPS